MQDTTKKSFLLYLDYAEHLDQLTDAECGQLLRAIFAHEDPERPEPTYLRGAAAMAYSFIKAQLDRDREEYEKKCETNRKNGLKGGRPPKPKESQETERFFEKPKKPDTDTDNDTDTDTDNDTDTETIKTLSPPAAVDAPKKDLQTERFDEFWKLYPRKVGKAAALKSWKKIKPTAELFERILTAVEAAKNSQQWQKDGGQYIPHPATWLNQGRWDDELTPAVNASRSTRGAGGKVDTIAVLERIYREEEAKENDEKGSISDAGGNFLGLS